MNIEPQVIKKMKNFHRQSSLERRRQENDGLHGFGKGLNRWISMNDLEMTEGVWLRKMRQILFPPESRPPFPTHISQLLPHLFIGNQSNADNLEGESVLFEVLMDKVCLTGFSGWLDISIFRDFVGYGCL